MIEKKEYKNMDFFKNQRIIEEIIDLSTENGKINNFNKKILKEIYLLSEYTNFKFIEDVDGDIDIEKTFLEIRKNNLWISKFVNRFHRSDLIEFEQLLDAELQEYVKQYERDNSIQSVIENFLSEVIAILPDANKMEELIQDLPSTLASLDEQKIERITNMVSKIK